MCPNRAAARCRRRAWRGRSLLCLPGGGGLEGGWRGMAHAIEVRNVYREFQQRSGTGARRPVRAVDGVTFSLPSGDVLGVVGESGCGKSTLARLIMGLLPPTSAEFLVVGRTLAAMDRREPPPLT